MTLPPLRRLVLSTALVASTLALAGCEQVEVIQSAPVVISFDSKLGNNPLAAGDAALLQEGLRVRAQVWRIRFDTQPAAAGNVDVHKADAVQKGRAAFTALTLTLHADAQATVEGFSSRGPEAEQAYCESLIQTIAQAGYVNLHDIHVEVYFNGSHHSTLSWNAGSSFAYRVLDGRP